MKYYPGLTPTYILNELSWDNLVLYMAQIPNPSGSGGDGGKEKKPEVKHASEVF